MEVTLTLKYGPANAEVTGEDREDVQDEFLELSEFLRNNQEEIHSLAAQPENGTVQTSLDQPSSPAQDVDSLLTPVAERTQVDIATIGELFDVPEDEEEVPHLKLYNFEEGEEVLGTNRNEQQARGSLMLLYLWHECRDVDEVESGQLSTALNHSYISPERRDSMYSALGGDADNYFNRNGSISLTPPGEHTAREEIQSLAERYESE